MGLFIAFEGLDGAGTTTQARLLADRLDEEGLPVHLTKEPSEGPVGNLISLVLKRRLVSPRAGRPLDPFPDDLLALLFAADRIDHLHAEILPKLREGVTVITDRYLLSSYAYQSLGCDLRWVREVNVQAILPDVTFLIDVPAPVCLRRIERERWETELFEGLDKLAVVRKNYLRLAASSIGEAMNMHRLDGEKEIRSLHREIWNLLRDQEEIRRREGGAAPEDRSQLRLTLGGAEEGPLSEWGEE
ncbi:MAG: dTMP kinase [Candidatus Eisenbacteria bacterium]|nr:dTMP kinase [Candidatus Eisenbacteria bacterium]